ACVCSAIAFLMALRLQSGYVRALEKSLHNRAVEIDPSIVEDSVTRSILMKSVITESPAVAAQVQHATDQSARAPAPADPFLREAAELRSGDQQRVSQTLQKLGPGDWTLAPLAIELLAWDSVMSTAREALQRMGPAITGMLVDVLLNSDRDFTVRRRVPRVLA